MKSKPIFFLVIVLLILLSAIPSTAVTDTRQESLVDWLYSIFNSIRNSVSNIPLATIISLGQITFSETGGFLQGDQVMNSYWVGTATVDKQDSYCLFKQVKEGTIFGKVETKRILRIQSTPVISAYTLPMTKVDNIAIVNHFDDGGIWSPNNVLTTPLAFYTSAGSSWSNYMRYKIEIFKDVSADCTGGTSIGSKEFELKATDTIETIPTAYGDVKVVTLGKIDHITNPSSLTQFDIYKMGTQFNYLGKNDVKDFIPIWNSYFYNVGLSFPPQGDFNVNTYWSNSLKFWIDPYYLPQLSATSAVPLSYLKYGTGTGLAIEHYTPPSSNMNYAELDTISPKLYDTSADFKPYISIRVPSQMADTWVVREACGIPQIGTINLARTQINEGEHQIISVPVTNKGSSTDTFTVSLYRKSDGVQVQSKQQQISSGAPFTFTFDVISSAVTTQTYEEYNIKATGWCGTVEKAIGWWVDDTTLKGKGTLNLEALDPNGIRLVDAPISVDGVFACNGYCTQLVFEGQHSIDGKATAKYYPPNTQTVTVTKDTTTSVKLKYTLAPPPPADAWIYWLLIEVVITLILLGLLGLKKNWNIDTSDIFLSLSLATVIVVTLYLYITAMMTKDYVCGSYFKYLLGGIC